MKNLRKNTVFFLLVLNLFISGCTIQIGESDPIEIALDQSRPSVATQVPEVSGTITDVRITAVERQFKDTIDEEYPNCTYLQIYYG